MNEQLDIPRVGFENRNFPKSKFDIVPLSFPLTTTFADHDPKKFHRNNFYIIMVVTYGKGSHSVDFKEINYRKGSIITIRKDQIHKFHASDAQGYALLFTEEFVVSYLEKQQALKTLQLFNELLGSPYLEPDVKLFDDILSLVGQMEGEYEKIKDEYSLGIIRSLLHILISKLYRIKSKLNSSFSELKYLEDFIQFQALVEKKCFTTRKVKDYADMMAISSKTVNNFVRAVLDKPAKRFIDEIFIIQLKRLLVNSGHSIKEIAYQAGFEDPSNLYKFFKKYTGTTPEKFRLNLL
ncbi:MAG: AraC family transcriptional regulator [Bacteroidia bacterium]|nr:AraC family transcriptional regulator [Bacteroidia bacterium]